MAAKGKGIVYLLHFTTPYLHARHYMGATGLSLDERLGAHRGLNDAGRPAKLLSALLGAGGDFVVADVWETETRAEAFELERHLKRFHAPGRVCSICHPNNKRGAKIRTPAMVRREEEAHIIREVEAMYPALELPEE